MPDDTCEVKQRKADDASWVLCGHKENREQNSDSEDDNVNDKMVAVDLKCSDIECSMQRAANVLSLARQIGDNLTTQNLVPRTCFEELSRDHLTENSLTLFNYGVDDGCPVRVLLSLMDVSVYRSHGGLVFSHERAPETQDDCFAELKVRIVSRKENAVFSEVMHKTLDKSGLRHIIVAENPVQTPTFDQLAHEYVSHLPELMCESLRSSMDDPVRLRNSEELVMCLDGLDAASVELAPYFLSVVQVTLFYTGEHGPPCRVVEAQGFEGLCRYIAQERCPDATVALFPSTRPSLVHEVAHLSKMHNDPLHGALIIAVDMEEGSALNTEEVRSVAVGSKISLYFMQPSLKEDKALTLARALWRAHEVDVQLGKEVLAATVHRVGEGSRALMKSLDRLKEKVSIGLSVLAKPFKEFWQLTGSVEAELDNIEKDHESSMRAGNSVVTTMHMTVHHLAIEWLGELIASVEQMADTLDHPVSMNYLQVFSQEQWQKYAQETAMLVQDETISKFRSWQTNVLLPEMIKNADMVHRTLCPERDSTLQRLGELKKKITSVSTELKVPELTLGSCSSDAVVASEAIKATAAGGACTVEMELVASLPHEVARTVGVYRVIAGAGKALSSHALLSQFTANAGLMLVGGILATAVVVKQLSNGTETAASAVRKAVCEQMGKSIKTRREDLSSHIGVVGAKPLESFVMTYNTAVQEEINAVRMALEEVTASRKGHDWMAANETIEHEYKDTLSKLEHWENILVSVVQSCEGDMVSFEHVEAQIACEFYNNM